MPTASEELGYVLVDEESIVPPLSVEIEGRHGQGCLLNRFDRLMVTNVALLG